MALRGPADLFESRLSARSPVGLGYVNVSFCKMEIRLGIPKPVFPSPSEPDLHFAEGRLLFNEVFFRTI